MPDEARELLKRLVAWDEEDNVTAGETRILFADIRAFLAREQDGPVAEKPEPTPIDELLMWASVRNISVTISTPQPAAPPPPSPARIHPDNGRLAVLGCPGHPTTNGTFYCYGACSPTSVGSVIEPQEGNKDE